MRFVTYSSDRGARAAGVRGGEYVDLNDADSGLPVSLKAILAMGTEGLERARQAIGSGRGFAAAGVQVLAPIPDPEKVICIGLNYADHAAESNQPIPPEPVVFNKFPTAVSSHGAPIVLPKLSDQVDYEAELVVVIGRGGRHIPVESAYSHVAGYACGHDVSARDWQLRKPGGQWLLGKTFDTFAPFGPELVTPDEVGNPGELNIALRVDGVTLQNSNTRQLIFSIDRLIAYVSGVCTLKSGDVLFTGTPPGVGAARKPPIFLRDGNVVEVEIEKLGVLSNPVIREA